MKPSLFNGKWMEGRMDMRYLYKDAFAVIGKMGQGPSDNPTEWILPLWKEANAHFEEIKGVIRKDEKDAIQGMWGAMNDNGESNKRWDDTGKYMASCEADVDAVAPEGWTKWVIPAQTYLVVDCTMDAYGEVYGKIVGDPDVGIVGTIHERYPEPGNPNVLELYVPIAEGVTYCQSCSMPLVGAEDFGTEADGSASRDYCQYCYNGGAFSKEETMEEMIESCIPFSRERYESDEAARADMMTYFPKLKRWAK